MKILTLMLTFLLVMAVSVGAVEIVENVNFDLEVKYKYVVNDLDNETNDGNRQYLVDVNPDYLFGGEAGFKLFDTVRISGHYDYIEHYQEQYGSGIEIYLPKTKYVDAGIVTDVLWVNDNVNDDESGPIFTAGLVFRIP